MIPQTYKAAKAAGWKTADEWKRQRYIGRVPKSSATCVIIKQKTFYRPSEVEEAISVTMAQSRGLKLTEGASPAYHRASQVGGGATSVDFAVYRLSDFRAASEGGTS